MSQRTAKPVTRRPSLTGIRADLLVEQLENRLPPAGHSLASASTPVQGPLDAASVGGYLATPDQVDLYRVHLGAGDELTTTVVAQTAGSGLAPILRVFAADSLQVADDDQEGGDPRLMFQAQAAGDYFIGVSSTGNADYDPVFPDDGSGGTSQGTYSLSLSVRANQPLLSDLVGSSFRLAETTASWGSLVHPTFTIENRGGAEADPFSVQLYLSPNSKIDPQDSVSLLTIPIGVGGLAPGGEWVSTNLAITLPSLAVAQAAGFPLSGPVAIGIRIIPSDAMQDSGTTDKGGVHRGEDWESLTVVTPVVGSVADLSQIDPALNTQASGTLVPNTPNRERFKVSTTLGAGDFAVQATSDSPSVILQLALYGGATGQTLLAQSQTGAGQPVATLTQYIMPGEYYLNVTGDHAIGYQLTTVMTPANDPLQPLSFPPVQLNYPSGVAVDTAGDLFIADNGNDVIREVAAGTGVITTIAGVEGMSGYSGDGGQATAAVLSSPQDVAVDAAGDLFIADSENNVIREVAAKTGVITTVAGTGTPGYSGDGGPASDAELSFPEGIAVDAAGDLFIADSKNSVIREVAAGTGVITTVAGTGTPGYSGDGGLATAAELSFPEGIAVDAAGDLFIADNENSVIREVAAGTGVITTVAGTGTPGYSGDEGQATAAMLNSPGSVRVDAAGDLFISDSGNSVIREVAAGTGVITTVAGTGTPGYSGDGGQATAAELDDPQDVAVDAAGDLFIADSENDVVREVAAGTNVINTISGIVAGDASTTGGQVAAPQLFDLAVGDFTDSGHLDMVSISQSSNIANVSLNIFLGNGDGTFHSASSLNIGSDPQAVVVADLNGDGKSDLVVANGDGTIGVLFGNGDGTFQPMKIIARRVHPTSVAVADLNGDGIPDIVFANNNGPNASGDVGILLGNGNGTFGPLQTVPVGFGPTSVAIADLNGDGIPDIVVTDSGSATASSNVEVLWGNGDGTFRPGPLLADGLGPRSVVVADLNGDGVPDLIVANSGNSPTGVGNTIGVFLGEGNGRFQPMMTTSVGNEPSSLAVADLNGDGTPDIVVTNVTDDTVGILLGKGDGTFAAEPAIDLPNTPGAVGVADVNGDGKPDLLVAGSGSSASPGSAVSVLSGNGDGSFQAPPLLTAGGGPVSLAVGDFNGDGKPDIVTADADRNQLTVELGHGDGTFTSETPIDVGADPQAVVTGDLNDDGKADLVVANFADNTVGVLLGNGDGTFRPMTTYPVGIGPCSLALADLTGNGVLDIVVANNGDATVGVLLGNGDGTFQPMQTYQVGEAISAHTEGDSPGPGPVSMVVADVNGDGKPDIIVTDDQDNTVDVLLGNGDGSFRPQHINHLPYAPDGVTVADVNGDGKPDIVLANPSANTVGVLFGNGDGTFQVERVFDVGDSPVAVAAGDVNGDGKNDLVVANSGDDTVSVLLAFGIGSFQEQRTFAVGQGPDSLSLTDVNDDGKLDIIVGNHIDNTISILLGNDDGTFNSATVANGLTVPNTPQLVDLTGAVGPTGQPISDSVILDSSGNILFRQGSTGVANQFDPPVTLNPGRPARDIVPLQTPAGWVIAAADLEPNPTFSSPGEPIYTISLYSVNISGQVEPSRIAFSTPLLPTRIFAGDLSDGGSAGDLVIANSLNNSIQVAIQLSSGAFNPLLTLATGGDPSDITFADLNSNGLNDIIVTNQNSGDISIFMNNISHSFSTSERIPASTSISTLNTSSIITTVAGNYFLKYYGDGGPATAAQLDTPESLAFDAAGNLYIADFGKNVVREVAVGTGIITTVAGSGTFGYSGDGGPATAAELARPAAVAVDKFGNLYIADYDNAVIRKVAASTGVITTIAGNGIQGYSGDGGPATEAELSEPSDVAVDSAGNLFIADEGDNVIREVAAATGVITTIAGNFQLSGNSGGYSGDGGPATSAELKYPSDLVVDAEGNIFFSDQGNNVIRKVAAGTDIITTIAGTGVAGYSGDGGSATSAQLNGPEGLTLDAAGNLLICDAGNNVIREIAAGTGVITTIAGNGTTGYSGDGGPAISAQFDFPIGIAINAAGNLFIGDNDNDVVREIVSGTDIITTIAGNHKTGYAGDGGPATAAQLDGSAVAVDNSGNLFIADTFNNVIREVSAKTGVITTIAGIGVQGYSGDGGPATSAELNQPVDLIVDAAGNVFFTDTDNNVVREVIAGTGVITTIAGNGVQGYSGDDGPATSAELNQPNGLTIDATGNLFIADTDNNVIREVAAGSGIITTVAGTGTSGYEGDGEPAQEAELSNPTGVAEDTAGNLFIADSGNEVIREVSKKTGVISTIAGNGTQGYSGDGGPAKAAALDGPLAIAVDAQGNLYISDYYNNVVREVAAGTGMITTIAGNGQFGYSGDGNLATSAELNGPYGISIDSAGNLFIYDNANNLVRKVSAPQTTISSLAQTSSLTIGDFTGTSHSDLLVVNSGDHSFSILPNNVGSVLTNPQAALTTSTSDGLAVNSDPGPVVAGDFNTADGLDDHRAGQDDVAILMESLGEVWIFTNNGNGTFQPPSSQNGTIIDVGRGATGLTLVPGSAPGLVNLLVGNQAGDVLILIGNGKGAFQALTLTGDLAPIAVQTVGSTDTPVALVANQEANQVTVQAPQSGFFQFATVTSLAPTDTTTQLAPGAVLWSPLDKGSTLADAIVMASGSNSMLIYRTTGLNAADEPIFASPVNYTVGTDPVSVTVADINGDGIPDLLVANKGSNDVSVLFGSYNSSGDWVGTPGPRLKSAGAGPISVNLVTDPASPGGHDLAITNQDGTVDIFPGRGQGFFDDRTPQVQTLGSPIAQPPVFAPGSELGYAVTTGGALLQFNLANPTTAPTDITSSGVVAAQVLPDGQVVEALAGGGVELVTPREGGESLLPLGGLPSAPSEIAVLTTSSGVEALVTSEGSDTIFAFATPPGSVEPLPFTTQSELTSFGSPFSLVSTLVTALPFGPYGNGTGVGITVFNPLLTGTASDLDAGALTQSVGLADTDTFRGVGESFIAVIRLNQIGDDDTGTAAPDAPAELQRLVTGTAEGLQRLIEAARAGSPGAAVPPSGATGADSLLEQLLRSIQELPWENPPQPPLPGGTPEEGTPNCSELDMVDCPHDRATENRVTVAINAQAQTDDTQRIDGIEEDNVEFERVVDWFDSAADGIPLNSGWDDCQEAAATWCGLADPDGPMSQLESASPLWLLAVLPAIVPECADESRGLQLPLVAYGMG